MISNLYKVTQPSRKPCAEVELVEGLSFPEGSPGRLSQHVYFNLKTKTIVQV